MKIITFGTWIKTQILQWNIFESLDSQNDPFRLRIALISTRIYAVLMIVIMINLIVYGFVSIPTETVTVWERNEGHATRIAVGKRQVWVVQDNGNIYCSDL